MNLLKFPQIRFRTKQQPVFFNIFYEKQGAFSPFRVIDTYFFIL